MSKQSSIEWLIDQVEDFIGLIPVDIIDQAKQMHKQEIKDAWDNGAYDRGEFMSNIETSQEYYNHIVDTNEMIDHIGDANKMVEAVEKLIDKDIFDQAILAMEEMYGSGCDAEIDAYFRGAKWMQKQLSNKQS